MGGSRKGEVRLLSAATGRLIQGDRLAEQHRNLLLAMFCVKCLVSSPGFQAFRRAQMLP